jgi:hypothetical protein
MFVRKAEFEKLVKHVQSQQQEIEKLHEMLGILAQSQGQQFQFDVGEGWKLSKIRPEHNQFIDDRRKRARASE